MFKKQFVSQKYPIGSYTNGRVVAPYATLGPEHTKSRNKLNQNYTQVK